MVGVVASFRWFSRDLRTDLSGSLELSFHLLFTLVMKSQKVELEVWVVFLAASILGWCAESQ